MHDELALVANNIGLMGGDRTRNLDDDPVGRDLRRKPRGNIYLGSVGIALALFGTILIYVSAFR
jgi:hypothetical protein